MLVLTRREGEVVNVGSGAAVIVLSINGGQVKLGFDFPKEVKVVRTEIADSGPNDAARRVREHFERGGVTAEERRARFLDAIARRRERREREGRGHASE